MFEQDALKLNTRCKGCQNQCKLSYTNQNEQYYPVINDTILYSYMDENGVEIPLYTSICESAADALNLGLNLSTVCDHYSHRFAKLQNFKTKIQAIRLPSFKKSQEPKTPQGFSQEQPIPTLVCQGCKKFCTIDVKTDPQNNYYPTIGDKLIDTYINPLTNTQESVLRSKCTSGQSALDLAKTISKLCKHQHLRKIGLIK